MAERAGAGLVALASLAAWARLHFAEADPRLTLASAALGWLLGSVLIGVSYSRRWGGSGRDALAISALVWVMLSLPAAPLLACDHGRPAALMFAGGYAVILALVARAQGRYAYTERRLPDLQGEARTTAEEALEASGLKPSAVLVAPFPSFNAFVQGLRTCVVIVDQRAAQELSKPELRALVAHEAGHLRRGDTLRHLAIPTLAMTWGMVLGLIQHTEAAIAPVALAFYFAVGPAAIQFAELRADRFAAALVGAEETGRMLRRVHADRPLGFERAASMPVLGAFLSHPPLEARLANLGLEHLPLPWTHFAGRFLRAALAIAPFGLALLGPKASAQFSWSVAGLAMVLYGASRLAVGLAARRSFRVAVGGASETRRAVLRVVLIGILAAAILVVAKVGGREGARVPILLLGGLGVIVLYATRSRPGARGRSIAGLPRKLRRAVVEAFAAVAEGKPERGLEALQRLPDPWTRDAWFRVARGSCLLQSGRKGEAAEDFRAAAEADPTMGLAWVELAITLLLSGDAARARDPIERACALAPEDPIPWKLKGTIHRERGEFQEAKESFSRVCALKPGEPAGLAGLALTAMDEGRPDAEIDALLDQALASGPRNPSAMLAHARRLKAAGRPAEALQRLREAVDGLGAGEYRIWIPYYESLARRWEILPPSA